MIGDESRGYILELLLTKLVYMKMVTPSLKLQVVAMSATFPNLDQVSRWLSAELYVTHFRPVQIREYVKTIGKVQEFFQILPKVSDSEPAKLSQVHLRESQQRLLGDSLNLWELIKPLDGQCLVFCSTKANCEQYATAFAS